MFTQDGQREAEKLNLEDSTVCVEDQRKIVEKQLSDAALVNYEEHMRDHHDTLKLMSNKAWAKKQSNDTKRRNLPNDWGERDAPLQCFGVEQDSLKEDDGLVKHDMMKCGSGGGARMEKRTRKDAEWKLRTRRDRSLASRVDHFAHGAAQRCAENCRGATDSEHYRVWSNDKSSNSECSETVEVLQKCRKSKGWSMSLSWCIGSFPPFKAKRRKPQSFRELCEEPACMFSKNCVVWTSTSA